VTAPAELRAPTPTAAPRSGARAGSRPDGRRWLRLVLPFAVATALIVGSGIAYSLQQPDPSDPAFLSPGSRAGIGAATLARLVAERGVAVERVAHTSDALVSAYRGDAVLLVPTPALVHPYYLRMLKLLPSSVRVVLVAPSQSALATGRVPVAVADQRLATAAVPPRCDLAAAVAAGRAAALRARFTGVDPGLGTQLHRCYGGGLVELRYAAATVDVIGTSDPFRNDRIGEHGNRALAVGLLTGAPRLVWLDLHRREPRPGLITDPDASAGAGEPPSLGPGPPDRDFPVPGTANPGEGAPRPGGGDAGGEDRGNPLFSAFPPVVWATIVLLLAAGVLLALALARRMGPPVPEPLPITIPAAETVHGRGRLYARAKARDAAVATLRAASRERLTRLLDAPPGAGLESLAGAVAARTGMTEAEVVDLFSEPVEDDETLVRVAAALNHLPHAVVAARPPVPDEGEPR
jgi:uncharacterized protein DUF4350